jgi:glycosyltransferase involved in cell wall biosynthesis
MLSIVVPVYNVEKYVAECLESLLQLDDAEIIVVNDGSSDSSLEVIVGIKQRNKNIKVITQENAGLSAARNAGLMACTGDYVYFVDSDDIVNTLGVGEAYSYAKQKSLDITQGHIEVFKDGVFNDRHLFRDARYRENEEILNGAKYFKKYVRSGEFPIPVFSNIYKRSYLLKHDLFFLKGVIHEDVEWVPRVFSMAGDVAFLNKTICYYRIREGSITNQQMLSKGSRSLDFLIIILKRYTDKDFTKKYFNNNKSLKKLWIIKIYLDALKEVKRQRENGFDNADKMDLLNSLALKELGFRYYMPELIRKRRKFL